MSKSRMIFASAVLALVALGLVLSPSHVLAKKSQAKARGLITALDTTSTPNTITVHDKKSDTDVTVNVDDSTRIHLDNVEGAALSDLAVGDKAHVRYNTETNLAKRIQAKSPRANLVGTIAAVDTGANTVTIHPRVGDDVTLNVTVTTKIERNDADATLADLVVGDHAHAKYDPLTMNAFKINAESAE